MTENRTSLAVEELHLWFEINQKPASSMWANKDTESVSLRAIAEKYKRMEEALASIQKSADTLGVDYEMYLAGIETEARHALAFDPLSL